VLCSSSPFFDAAFSKEWKENEEESISLPEEKHCIFSIFLQWAFTGHVVLGLATPTKENINVHYRRLFDLYIFGDKYNSKSLKNQVIDSVIATKNLTNYVPAAFCVLHVVANVPTGSKLLEWLFDIYVYNASRECFKVEQVRTCPEFFSEVLMRNVTLRLSREVIKRPAAVFETCYYHEHDESTPKCE